MFFYHFGQNETLDDNVFSYLLGTDSNMAAAAMFSDFFSSNCSSTPSPSTFVSPALINQDLIMAEHQAQIHTSAHPPSSSSHHQQSHHHHYNLWHHPHHTTEGQETKNPCPFSLLLCMESSILSLSPWDSLTHSTRTKIASNFTSCMALTWQSMLYRVLWMLTLGICCRRFHQIGAPFSRVSSAPLWKCLCPQTHRGNNPSVSPWNSGNWNRRRSTTPYAKSPLDL